MADHTFLKWLERETTAAKYSLLMLQEQKDKLLYLDGPRLEQEYMEKIGSYEETVIKQEIECELLKEKQQMIQIAINRNQPVDESAIDAEIELLRQQIYKKVSGAQEQSPYSELTQDEADELQQLYSEIVKDFHPQTHPELTEVHRTLFHKAHEAYR